MDRLQRLSRDIGLCRQSSGTHHRSPAQGGAEATSVVVPIVALFIAAATDGTVIMYLMVFSCAEQDRKYRSAFQCPFAYA